MNLSPTFGFTPRGSFPRTPHGSVLGILTYGVIFTGITTIYFFTLTVYVIRPSGRPTLVSPCPSAYPVSSWTLSASNCLLTFPPPPLVRAWALVTRNLRLLLISLLKGIYTPAGIAYIFKFGLTWSLHLLYDTGCSY